MSKLTFRVRFCALPALFFAAALASGCGGELTTEGGAAEGGSHEGGSAALGGNDPVGGAPEGGQGEGGAPNTDPIDAPDEQWTFVDFPDAVCMNGTPTGIGINPTTRSEDVVIFLMGGNACFNFASCLIVANPDGYDSAKFDAEVADTLSTTDYFDRDNPDNPFRDFSYVFVPYCTGDVHAGDKSDVEISNTTYQFHGFTNMTKYLGRVVPTFPAAGRVVLTGVSAGGFGAAYNYDQVATAFGDDVNVTLIDDSGPPMAEEFVPQCLQQFFLDTWGIDATLPSDCADCGASGVWMEPFVNYIIDKYGDRNLGLVSSEGDETIRTFWGFGENDCASLNGIPDDYPEAKYKAGLEDLRDRIAADTRFRMYLVPGTEHVFVDNGFNSVSVDGVFLEDWIAQAIDDDPAWSNVSAP